jgi:hypothetical protein
VTPHAEPSWKAPHLAAATSRRNRSLFTFLLVLIVATSLYEGLLIKPAVAVALHSSNELSYVVAFLIALAAAVSMMEAGHLQRKTRVEGDRSNFPTTLIVGWALFGLGLTALRFVPEPRAVSFAGTFQTAASPADSAPNWLIAIVMLVVYVGAGLLSRAAGYSLLNPVAQAHASVRRERARLERLIRKQRPKTIAALERLEVARGDFAAITTQRQGAGAVITAFFDQLLERARIRMLLPFGDPSITSAISAESPDDDGGVSEADVPAVRAVL